MFEFFYKHLQPIAALTNEEKIILESAFIIRQVPKKVKLLQEGKTARELYFIVKGLIRLFYTKEGEEITGYIFKEGLFASSYESFLRQTPGIQTLETLEECDLLTISYSRLQQLYEEIPKMHIIARKVAEQRFISAQIMLSSFILDSPEERYKKFEQEQGDLLLRVPHHIIASFLGITPVSLSRIRKRLKK
ncbi:MAG: Crp/Fnr family transcriptional regulator [Bacteroidetes bacterium]|nr:Crp/Fnr family transcriptional regulator [Bacteroidota bacterium]